MNLSRKRARKHKRQMWRTSSKQVAAILRDRRNRWTGLQHDAVYRTPTLPMQSSVNDATAGIVGEAIRHPVAHIGTPEGLDTPSKGVWNR